MKEAAIHRPIAQHADCSGITVWEDRFGTELVRDVFEARSNRFQRFIPGHAFKRFVLAAAFQGTFRTACLPFQRIQNPRRRIDPVKILGHLPAQKSLRHRMLGVARHLDRTALFVHGHKNPATVRAVVGADRVNDAKGSGCGSRGHSLIVS